MIWAWPKGKSQLAWLAWPGQLAGLTHLASQLQSLGVELQRIASNGREQWWTTLWPLPPLNPLPIPITHHTQQLQSTVYNDEEAGIGPTLIPADPHGGGGRGWIDGGGYRRNGGHADTHCPQPLWQLFSPYDSKTVLHRASPIPAVLHRSQMFYVVPRSFLLIGGGGGGERGEK